MLTVSFSWADNVGKEQTKKIITNGKIISSFLGDKETFESIVYDIIYQGELYRCRVYTRREISKMKNLEIVDKKLTMPYISTFCYDDVIRVIGE